MLNDFDTRYPEHAKQREAIKPGRRESEVLSEFAEWLGTQGYWLAERRVVTKQYLFSDDTYEAEADMPVLESWSKLFARFFDLDLDVLDREKRTMLEELREQSEKARS